MLMDLFYSTAHVRKKQRVHFNAFMLDVHNSKSSYILGLLRLPTETDG